MDLSNLAPMDVSGRVDRLRQAMEQAQIPALLLTHLTSIRYLTGFTGSAALLLVSPDGLTFVTDGRYGQQSEAELKAAGVNATIEVSSLNQKDIVIAAVGASGATRLGLEAESVTWSAVQTYDDKWFPDLELVSTTGLVGELRLIKDDGELARLEAAAAIADSALAKVRHRLNDRPTETEFALELNAAMRSLGADDLSFETIVASGPNGALPHHHPGTRTITGGDLVVIDFGALVDGYHSDMTRTIAVGDISDTQQKMWDVVARSQAAGVEAVASEVACKDVDTVCRDIIVEAGWGEAFLHGTGHGVGLDIHEDPRVAQSSTATLVERCVITVEPGVYLPAHGGVRIEDTVVVTSDGCRPITLAPKTIGV